MASALMVLTARVLSFGSDAADRAVALFSCDMVPPDQRPSTVPMTSGPVVMCLCWQDRFVA
jgi:hypothetical protein